MTSTGPTSLSIYAMKLPSHVVMHCVLFLQVCAELDVDGLRGDLVTTRAARAAAAFR